MKIAKNKNWTSSIKEFFVKNKIITMTVVVFFMCLILNFVLIFNFMRILENM